MDIRFSKKSELKFPIGRVLIFIIALPIFFGSFVKNSNAYYVYNRAAEERRNARQIPCDEPYVYDRDAEERRNARQIPRRDRDDSDVDERYEDYYDKVYRKTCEKIKNKKDRNRCKSHAKSNQTKSTSPFLNMYFRDYADDSKYNKW